MARYKVCEEENRSSKGGKGSSQRANMGVREIQVADKNIVIHELDDVYDATTGTVLTGSWVWNSALILAEWMATQCKFSQFDLGGKSVIELGAGAGLPGLMAALLGASRVVLTDIDQLLPGLLKNVEANRLEELVEVRELVWGSDEAANQTKELGEFDMILMSDVFYDPEEMLPLAHVIKSIFRKGTTIWAASEVRPWTSECLNELRNQGFMIEESPVKLGQSSLEDYAILDSFAIYHLEPSTVVSP